MGLFDRFRRSKTPDEANVDDRDDEQDLSVVHDADLHAETDDLDESDLDENHVDAAEDSAAEDSAEDPAESDADESDAEDEEDYAKAAPVDRLDHGPWDSEEEFAEENRIDLGALQVPVRDGMQVRLDAEDGTNRILAVTLVHRGGAVQLQAFAAPRSEGLWKSVRTQIRDNVTQKGGAIDELDTELGAELLTKIPARTSDGKAVARVARFAGVDGPRWFMRGIFSGKAVTDAEVRAELVKIFRGTVVQRGTEAMPPRDLLVLSQPKAAQAQDGAQAAAGQNKKDDDINPFERGPEITEVR